MKKNYSSRKEALDRAYQLAPTGTPAARCVRETSSGKFTLCVNGKIIKPPDFKQPNADSLAQAVTVERGTSEVPCVIDQDAMGFLKACPMGHTADSCPSAFAFANMAVQADELMPQVKAEIPDELKQTIGSRLWLANFTTQRKAGSKI